MSDKYKTPHKGIFKLSDKMLSQLNSMRKMFLIMIITSAIIPPLLMLGMIISVDPPSESAQVIREKILLAQLKNNEISQEFISEMESALDMPPIVFGNGLILYLIILGVAFSWLPYGIKKWVFLSKWGKKYEEFKERQNKIDKIIQDEFENEK